MSRESEQQHDESWAPCPPGTLLRMTQRVRETRRRDATRRITSVLAVVCLLAAGAGLGAATWIAARTPDAPAEFTALRCSEIRDLLVQYGHGTLADKLRQTIAAHLRECPSCREHHRKLQEEQAKKQTSWLVTKVPVKT
jgi:hypothetical protein